MKNYNLRFFFKFVFRDVDEMQRKKIKINIIVIFLFYLLDFEYDNVYDIRATYMIYFYSTPN